MAWSDAARAAALAVRRAHAGYKKQYSKNSGKFLSAETNASARRSMALQLRAYRKPNLYQNPDSGKWVNRGWSESAMHDAASNAAASTRLRNLARSARKSATAVELRAKNLRMAGSSAGKKLARRLEAKARSTRMRVA